MNDVWQSFLEEHGARMESGLAADFGDAGSERQAARGQSIVADLSHLAILEFSGEDAASFLHGQLTCDVNAIAPGSAAFGGYCTPKGRLLAGYGTLQSRCHVSSSSDGGLTWKFELELEGPDGRPIGEYPSFENLPDGRILAAYDNGKPIWSVVYNILQEE